MREPDGLWLFDGVCNFCSWSVRTILRFDRAGTIRFTPVQSPYGEHLCATAGLDPADPQSFAFFVDGVGLHKSDAIIALLGRLPAPWRWGAVIGVAPRPLRDAAYDVLARNRYRWFGRKDACMIPTADERARFISEIPG